MLEQTRARMAGGGASVLGGVRDRMGAHMRSGDWAELSRGRLEFGRLATELKHGAELQRRIVGLLGATPASVDLVRYEGKARSRISVTAAEATRWGKKLVAFVTTDDGKVVEQYVSR